jgi:hypothetical protein
MGIGCVDNRTLRTLGRLDMGYVALAYVIGLVVASLAYSWRAGLPIGITPWSGHKVYARYPAGPNRTGDITGGAGFVWWQVRIGKQLAWPVIFIVWLVKGRPEPARQFNKLAEQRLAEEAGIHHFS